MMKNRVLPVAIVFAITFALIIVVLGTLIIVLRPSMIWGSEQKLLDIVQSSSPSYDDILTKGEEQRLDHTVKTNEHVFTLNSIHWPADRSIVCIVHSTQSPSLTAFGDGIERSKSVGAIYLTDDTGSVYKLADGSGFTTDVVDTVSWFNCFEAIPADREEFLLILGERGVPGKYANFTITIPK